MMEIDKQGGSFRRDFMPAGAKRRMCALRHGASASSETRALCIVDFLPFAKTAFSNAK